MVRRDHRYPVSRLMPRLMRKQVSFILNFKSWPTSNPCWILPILVRGREEVQKKVRNADSFWPSLSPKCMDGLSGPDTEVHHQQIESEYDRNTPTELEWLNKYVQCFRYQALACLLKSQLGNEFTDTGKYKSIILLRYKTSFIPSRSNQSFIFKLDNISKQNNIFKWLSVYGNSSCYIRRTEIFWLQIKISVGPH